MDYEKKYKEAIKKAKSKIKNDKDHVLYEDDIIDIFPELAESEDKRIWKGLLYVIEHHPTLPTEEAEEYIAWLEKQGKQKLYVNDNAKEMFIKALERVEQQNNKGYKLTDCDKNSWWEDFKVYTTSWQNLANSAKTCKDEQKPVPDWMPKFLDELRSKKNYFGWDEHRDFEGGIVAIINWMNPNYFNEKDGEQKPADKVELKFHKGEWITIKE